jgi:putative salt-induced outer membrane protein YdiY
VRGHYSLAGANAFSLQTPPMKQNSIAPILVAAFAGGLVSTSVAADAGTNRWESSAAAGLTLTRGNSETLLGTLSLKTQKKYSSDEFFLGASGAYGETTVERTVGGKKVDETEKTTENLAAFGQWNHLFNERLYGGFRADFLHDGIADLDYRFTLSPLVGYYLVKEPRTKLSIEVGPSGVIEKQGEEDNQYCGLRIGERFEHKLSDTARVWQSIEYVPQVDRTHNYLIIAEIGAEASLTKELSLRATLQDVYDNEPAAGRKRNDVKLITSIVYKF